MKDNNKLVRTFIRISIGFIFFWAFIDKTFGLGYPTPASKAWLGGTSPTYNYLEFSTSGPFANFFQSIAGSTLIDWLFMLGLLGIGIALLLGVAIKASTYSAILMLGLIFLTSLPPQNNPIIDEHIIYILLLLGLSKNGQNTYFNLNKWWSKSSIVKKFPFLA